MADAETVPVPSGGDAADDPAIWVHPTDPNLSLVIGTDKDSGVGTYDLDGSLVEFLSVGEINNIDVRYDFPLGGDFVDIVAAGNRTDQSIDVFRIDPNNRAMIVAAAGPLPVGVNEAYGFCMYRSWFTGKTYVFVNDKDGEVEQYELVDNGAGLVDAVLVRTLSVGGQTEGMVADDEYGLLYIGEEAHGIWRYGAEPTDGPERVEVDNVAGPNLTADVEGLSLYYKSDGHGYLLASSQGSNSFAIYERLAGPGQPNQYLKSFVIVPGQFDGCAETDGIDVTSVALGSAFPQGMFVAQDGVNANGNQNYKMVHWSDIATAGMTQLDIDTGWDPRGGPVDQSGACCIGGGCEEQSPIDCFAQGGEYQGHDTSCDDSVCVAPPGPATDPDPPHGTNDASLGSILAWTAGSQATSHDVYFGVDSSPDASEFQGNQPGTTFVPPGGLQPNTTYYWRIDEVNPGGVTTGSVWSFSTEDPLPPPGPATGPNPSNGAGNVSIATNITWVAGANATSHNVYFGTDPSPDAGEFQGNQASTFFDPGTLQESTTYFWRIDEVNGSATTPGDVWSFTTQTLQQPPGPATFPSPDDGADGTLIGVDLSWVAGAGAESHRVYFGTDPTPDAGEFQGAQGATTFDPGALNPMTTYYWRIDEVNDAGTTVGNVWSFTTGDGLFEINFLSISTFSTNNGASFNIGQPAGTTAGDFLLMVVGKERAGQVFTPDGWTLVNEGTVGNGGNQIRLEVFSRLAGANEPASYHVTTAEDKKTYAAVMRYCCTHEDGAIADVAVSTGNSSTPTAPSVTTAAANSLIIRVFGAKNDDLPNNPYPSGHAGRFAITGGDKTSGGAADRLQENQGQTGSASFQLTSSNNWRAVSIAVTPPDPPDPPEPPACPADVDGDSEVGVLDLAAVIVNWGATSGPADVDGDGIVGVYDIVEVITNWGPCPP